MAAPPPPRRGPPRRRRGGDSPRASAPARSRRPCLDPVEGKEEAVEMDRSRPGLRSCPPTPVAELVEDPDRDPVEQGGRHIGGHPELARGGRAQGVGRQARRQCAALHERAARHHRAAQPRAPRQAVDPGHAVGPVVGRLEQSHRLRRGRVQPGSPPSRRRSRPASSGSARRGSRRSAPSRRGWRGRGRRSPRGCIPVSRRPRSPRSAIPRARRRSRRGDGSYRARPPRTFKRYNGLLGRAPACGTVPEREQWRQRKSL